MLTNGHITLVNGCIKAKMYALTIRWMYKMNVYIKMLICLLLKATWLTLEQILRIGPFSSSGEEKQSWPF